MIIKISGPKKKPIKPSNFKPINIDINVGSGVKPTPVPNILGSNIFLCTNKIIDNIIIKEFIRE